MANKSTIGSSRSTGRHKKENESVIPNETRAVGAVIVEGEAGTSRKVPCIILQGEWLKKAGFAVGTGIYLTTDDVGEMTIHRVAYKWPRRLHIIAARKLGRAR